MYKIEDTFVTVKGTFAISESRARCFVFYKTNINIFAEWSSTNQQIVYVSSVLLKTNHALEEYNSTTLYGIGSYGIRLETHHTNKL